MFSFVSVVWQNWPWIRLWPQRHSEPPAGSRGGFKLSESVPLRRESVGSTRWGLTSCESSSIRLRADVKLLIQDQSDLVSYATSLQLVTNFVNGKTEVVTGATVLWRLVTLSCLLWSCSSAPRLFEAFWFNGKNRGSLRVAWFWGWGGTLICFCRTSSCVLSVVPPPVNVLSHHYCCGF